MKKPEKSPINVTLHYPYNDKFDYITQLQKMVRGYLIIMIEYLAPLLFLLVILQQIEQLKFTVKRIIFLFLRLALVVE